MLRRYTATYQSPRNGESACGTFEFDSSAKKGSKQNARDARLRMLEIFGSKALSWVICDIDNAQENSYSDNVQTRLDFRQETPAKQKVRRTVRRGVV